MKIRLSRKRSQRVLLISLMSLLLVLGLRLTKQSQPTALTDINNTYQVTQVFDGDTIEVNMNEHGEKVRFIGVDTPETHDPRKSVQCFGQAAATFTKDKLKNHRVRLVADPINTNRDRYERLLRYVYTENGELFNATLIKEGYGFAYLGFPFTKSDEFRNYQIEARQKNRGLWSSCHPSENQYNGFTSNDEK